jgi:hypothetical protein
VKDKSLTELLSQVSEPLLDTSGGTVRNRHRVFEREHYIPHERERPFPFESHDAHTSTLTINHTTINVPPALEQPLIHDSTSGFHVPNVRHRDLYYQKLEDKREQLGRS